MSKAHPGFKAVEAKIAKRINPHTHKVYGYEHAGAILGWASRHASKAAKRANPHLKRVKG